MSFVQGTGAIEWLWNLNTYMSEDNEVPIGSIRADGTMKAQGRILSDVARFVNSTRDNFKGPLKPDIAIVTSQALQYSVLNGFASLAQQHSVRALAYGARLPAYIVPENQLAALGSPKLVILPSPQALTGPGWNALEAYVEGGGNLLISGPVGRDEHWHLSSYGSEFLNGSKVLPVTFSQYEVNLGSSTVSFHYSLQSQNLLEWQRFTDNSSFKTFSIGRGHIFWISIPIELSDDLDSTAHVYSAVATLAHVASPFAFRKPLGSGVLVYPQVLGEHVLYLVSSESAVEETVSLRDSTTGADLDLRIAPQRAALVFIKKSDGKISAKYGGE